MSESNRTIQSTIIRFGTYFGLIVVAYNFISSIMGLSNEISWMAIGVYLGIFFISIFVIIPLAQLNQRKLNNNLLSLGEGMKIGLGIFLIGFLMVVISQIIIWEFITDKDQLVSSAQEFMMDTVPPEMLTDEMLEQNARDARNPFSFRQIASRISFNLIIISLYTLITGLVIKKSKSN